jgi:hypothetical protein
MSIACTPASPPSPVPSAFGLAALVSAGRKRAGTVNFVNLMLALAAALLLSGCATTAAPARDSLDAVARDYVALVLELGERDQG